MDIEIINVVLGPFLMLTVQVLKQTIPALKDKSILMVFVGAFIMGSFVVDWTGTWQSIGIDFAEAVLTIAGVASGLYSWKKSTDTVELPDYGDNV